MKKIFLYIAVLLPSLAFAQAPEAFTLKSKVGNLNAPAKAFLLYRAGADNVIDSSAITNGAFNFSGDVKNPVNAIIAIDHKGVGFSKLDNSADVISFYLEKGTININSASDSIAKAEVTGSQVNDDNKILLAQLKPVNDKVQKLIAESGKATPEQKRSVEFQNGLQTRYKAIQTEQKEKLKSFIIAHPNSYLSLFALSSVGGPAPDPNEMDPLYKSLAQNLRESEAGMLIKKSIDALKVTANNSMAPDFTQNDVNGKPVKLSSFRGKYVLLDFWASWCGPCRQENPNVVKAYNQYKSKNFTIVGVSLDKPEGKAAWLEAIKNDGLTWTQVSDLKFWQNEVAALYSVQSIPQNFLIDPQGKIIAKNLRGADLENKLAELFGK